MGRGGRVGKGGVGVRGRWVAIGGLKQHSNTNGGAIRVPLEPVWHPMWSY